MKLAVFDCDGTLVDSQASICAAMGRAFDRYGVEPPSRGAVQRIVGLSVVEAVAALLPDAEADFHLTIAQAYKAAFHALRAEGRVEEPLFEGTIDALAAIAARGWALGVATGKSERGLALVLAEHGITDLFVTLQTADHHPSKPSPAMLLAAIADAGGRADTTVMIGDTSYDMAMARAGRVRAVGVAWGYHEVAEMHRAGADAIAVHPSDLVDLLEAQ